VQDRRPLLAAALVVRDEARQLSACLAGLADVVDEVVVHDTGSVDATVEIARGSGAIVHEGYWDDDFARARNVALGLTVAEWVLVLDADERVTAQPPPDPAALARLLAVTRADVLTVAVRNVYPEELGGSYRHAGPRLLRRRFVEYAGRVHEQPLSRRGGVVESCPPEVLGLDHLGYADAAVVRAKAARNAEIARAELRRLGATAPGVRGLAAAPEALAKVVLDLGRSLVICGGRQEAVDAFEVVRALVPGRPRAVEATDALARVLLAAGMDDAVLVLAEQLRAAGVDGRYCDWLRAQALAQLGGAAQALVLLRSVDLLRDSGGRELDLGQVVEMRGLVAQLAGCGEEAVTCLLDAMVGHGRLRGRGPVLLDVWGARPPQELARRVGEAIERAREGPGAPDRHADVVAELARCHPPGPDVAAALAEAGDSRSVEACTPG
jgi:hypothetical protein